MALLRVMHAADLPDPGALVKRLEEMAANGIAAAPAANGTGSAPAAPAALNWGDVVEQVKRSGQLTLASRMELQVRVVDLAPGRLVYALAPGFRDDITRELRDGLNQLGETRWEVERSEEGGASTLVERQQDLAAEQSRALRESPLVKAAFEAFPGAELVEEEPGRERSWARR